MELNWTPEKAKAAAIAALSFAAVCLGAYQAQAVYSVHDSKVYAEVVAQVEKATEQISQLKQQIDNQLKDLKSLKAEEIDPYLNEIRETQDAYNSLKHNMSSIVSGVGRTEDAWKNAFDDFTDFNPRHASYAEINSKREKNRATLEQSNKEIMELIAAKQDEMEQSQLRLQAYNEKIRDVEGDKQISQLQAMIQNEQIIQTGIGNEIEALRTRQTMIQSQIGKLEKDADKALMDKTAADFGAAAEELEGKYDPNDRVDTLTPYEDKVAQRIGWF